MNKIIYQDKTGYISGYYQEDKTFYLYQFLIYPDFRGKGLARKLAKYIPKKCELMVVENNEVLNQQQLVSFYESLGFIKVGGKRNILMKRN
jgi:ribosomal protein S18 acetylase RimI-like enzyme